MQIKWTSGQFKIMISGPEYIAKRSVWWKEGMKALICDQQLHLSKQVFYRWMKQRMNFSEDVYKSITMGSFEKSIVLFNDSWNWSEDFAVYFLKERGPWVHGPHVLFFCRKRRENLNFCRWVLSTASTVRYDRKTAVETVQRKKLRKYEVETTR